MAQRAKGERVLGPYPIGRQWRVVVVGAGGERDSRFYPTEEDAKKVIRAVRKEFAKASTKTMQEALDAYELYLRYDKQNKPGSVDDTIYRLGVFFPDRDLRLCDLSARTCEGYYEALRTRATRNRKPFSVDSHRTMLAAAKTFLRWCAARPRCWLAKSPAEEVQGVGKRRHGKPQLRIDEARRWTAKAIVLANAGEPEAVAALVALLMGMRASEIVSRVVRDLDDEGRLLWIPDSKTEAGKANAAGTGDVAAAPAGVRRGEEAGGARVRAALARLDPEVGRRVCVAAGVPSVTAHAMRGLHSTLALEHGASAHVVAVSLGHASISTTLQSYAKPEAVEGAKQRRVLTVLQGGELAS